jgi:hypothetical protein
MRDFLKNCGVTLVDIGIVNLTEKNDLLLFRNRFLLSFFKPRTPLFDRVIVTDLFDTVFQGDPFTHNFDRTRLGFSVESRLCDLRHQEGSYVLIGRRNTWRIFAQLGCINAGTMIGVESTILTFVEQWADYLRQLAPERLARITYVPDQVIVNVLIRMGLISNVQMRFYNGFEEYIAMWKWFGIPNVTYRLGGFRLWADGTYPTLVHMYDRGHAICASVSEICPPLFPTVDQYTRCFVPGW